jgi:hypothetical protein
VSGLFIAFGDHRCFHDCDIEFFVIDDFISAPKRKRCWEDWNK